MEAGLRRPHPIPDFVRLHARARPCAIALQDAGSSRVLTYSSLDRMIGSAVTFLEAVGVERGSRVAALCRNSIELIILQLACARSGAILAPLNWRLAPIELEAIVADCDPTLLIKDGSLQAITGISIPVLSTSDFAERSAAAHPAPPRVTDTDLASLMLYTSGTSGSPKGVLLTERNLFASAVNFALLGEVTADSAFLLDAPMFHIIGMVTNVRSALMVGAKVVVSSGFDPETTLARLGDPSFNISHYFCVPQMAEMLRASPKFDARRLRPLKALFTGGGPQTPDQIRSWLAEGIPLVNGYGMTEAGTVLGMPLAPSLINRKIGSAGLLAPTIATRLVREDGSLCSPGEAGELLLSGENICAGYWRQPDETANAFTSDGFLRTGDLAREDEDGFFYIVGRKKDMYISGGENVYPAEIETVLRSHPAVDEVAVLGVPDPKWGEAGHAFILLAPGAEADEGALRALCERSLARYKLPRTFEFVADLPRTGSGKVMKARLRKKIQEVGATG